MLLYIYYTLCTRRRCLCTLDEAMMCRQQLLHFKRRIKFTAVYCYLHEKRLCAANSHVSIGSFELDPGHGENPRRRGGSDDV